MENFTAMRRELRQRMENSLIRTRTKLGGPDVTADDSADIAIMVSDLSRDHVRVLLTEFRNAKGAK